jgi:hypothetical protein
MQLELIEKLFDRMARNQSRGRPHQTGPVIGRRCTWAANHRIRDCGLPLGRHPRAIDS